MSAAFTVSGTMPAAFIWAVGAFRTAVNLSGRILAGSMSQRRPGPATSALPVASAAVVENRKCLSPEQWLRCLPNFQLALSRIRLSQLAPL